MKSSRFQKLKRGWGRECSMERDHFFLNIYQGKYFSIVKGNLNVDHVLFINSPLPSPISSMKGSRVTLSMVPVLPTRKLIELKR